MDLPKIKSLPYPVIAFFISAVLTAAGYLFIYGAKLMYALPQNLDVPWFVVFAVIFFALLLRNRIKVMRSDQKPELT